jgi:hypothetical protein
VREREEERTLILTLTLTLTSAMPSGQSRASLDSTPTQAMAALDA